MGLDQYAIATREGNENQVIMYWRKHNRLQGWMEDLWRKRGGTDEFNCVPVILTLADLDQLEKDIACMDLPETHGFFFGTDSYGRGYDPTADLQFITEARQRILDGWEVQYDSWW